MWRMGRGLGPGSGRVGWCYVCVSLDSLCRWQVQVSIYCARRLPAHLRYTRYLFPIVYLFVIYMANPDLFVCSCRTWICLDIAQFYEEQCQTSSGSARPALKKVNRSTITAVTCRLCRLNSKLYVHPCYYKSRTVFNLYTLCSYDPDLVKIFKLVQTGLGLHK